MVEKIKKYFFSNISPKQIVIKNSFWLLLAEGIAKCILFILTIIIARYLGPESYGEYSFAFNFVTLFIIVVDFGFNKFFVREVSRQKNRAKKFIDNILFIKLILFLKTFLLIVITIQFLDKTSHTKLLVYLVVVWIGIQSFNQFFQSIFQVFEKMEYEAIARVIMPFSLLIFVGITIWFDLGMHVLIISYVVAGIITLLFLVRTVRKRFVKFNITIDLEFLKYIIKEAWPFALMVIGGTIYFSIDITLLSYFKDDFSVGVYSACVNIYRVALLPSAMICTALFPRISVEVNNPKFPNLLKKLVFFQMGSGLIMILLMMPIIDKLLLFLYGQEFSDTLMYIKIILCLVPLRYVNFMLGDSLSALNIQRKRTRSILICTGFNFLTNLYFIPHYGIMGALATTIATEFLLMFQYCYYNISFFKHTVSIRLNHNSNQKLS